MKSIYQKYKKVIKISATILVSSGFGLFLFQLHKTHRLINKSIDTTIIDLLEPKVNNNFDSKEHHFKSLIEKYRIIYLAGPLAKWNRLKFIYAQRLVSLAKFNVKILRQWAIYHLSKIHNLESWQYEMLSQICDAAIAVSLARCPNSDLKMIKEPIQNKKSLEEDVVEAVKHLLNELKSCSDHHCINYFLETVFPSDHDHTKYFDHDHPDMGLTRILESSSNVLFLCVESLLHHSSDNKQAGDIALHKGISLLMEIYKLHQNNKEVQISLCKILSNISASFSQTVLNEMHSEGWIRVLAEWSRDLDLRLSLPAVKTLANLEEDKYISGLYSRSLYVLYPTCNMHEDVYVDVVFIHGLLGGVFYTWRQRTDEKETVGLIGKQRDKGQPKSRKYTKLDKVLSDPVESISSSGTYYTCPKDKESKPDEVTTKNSTLEANDEEEESEYEFLLHDLPTKSNVASRGPYTLPNMIMKKINKSEEFSQCWPKDWLPNDCKHLRIIGINYDTNLSMWAGICPMEKSKTTIEERSNEMMAKLLKAGVGDRPIVWVTHSMGGLIAKNILCKAWKSEDSNVRKLAKKTRSIIFYSTPHTGSKVASATSPTSFVLWPSVEVQELRQEYAGLHEIHKNFLEYNRKHPLDVVSFIETKPILVTAMKFNVLLVEPESGNPGIGEYFEIPLDHLGICKPKNKESFLYQKTLHTILKVINEEKYGCDFFYSE